MSISKHSDTEYKKIITIPEVPAIPERIVEEIIPFEKTKNAIESAKAEIDICTEQRKNNLIELAQIDAEIADLNTLISKLEAEIEEAEALDIVEK